MARALRVQYPSAIFHVLSQGDRRKLILWDDQDPAAFVGTLEQPCAKTGWQLQAWCLMSNHFHVAFETPRANPSCMKWYPGTKPALQFPALVARIPFSAGPTRLSCGFSHGRIRSNVLSILTA